MEEVKQKATNSQIYGSGTWKILMAESGLNMFMMRIICFILNICSLFLAVPWTTTMYYNAWAQNVQIDGKNLKFTGKATGFFGVWLKTLLLSAFTLGIYYLVIGRKILQDGLIQIFNGIANIYLQCYV